MTPTTSIPVSPAGFWKRYVAYFIDAALLWGLLELLVRLFFPHLGEGEMDQLGTLLSPQDPEAGLQAQAAVAEQAIGLLMKLTLVSTCAYAVVGGVYFVLFEASDRQATPGKRLLGIKVTDLAGRRIDRGRAVGRFLAAALSWMTMNIGHALVAWTPERRALHDMLAGTRVVNADPERPQMPWWGWLIVAANVLGFLAFVVMTIVGTWNALTAAGQY